MIRPGPWSILIGMEASGTIRDSFRARGFDAWSCDLRPCEGDPRWHLRADVFPLLRLGWRAGIFHPDCTFLTSSGLHWNRRVHGRHASTLRGFHHVRLILAAPIPHKAVENPRGCIGTQIRRADQLIKPPQFGEDAAKETYLWLDGLPKLRPTGWRPGRIVEADPQHLFGGGVERWSNQADDGNNRLGETAARWIERSRTYPGIANAMADQWGAWLDSVSGGQARATAPAELEPGAILTEGGWIKACNTPCDDDGGVMSGAAARQIARVAPENANGPAERENRRAVRGAGAETGQSMGGCPLTCEPISRPEEAGNP